MGNLHIHRLGNIQAQQYLQTIWNEGVSEQKTICKTISDVTSKAKICTGTAEYTN